MTSKKHNFSAITSYSSFPFLSFPFLSLSQWSVLIFLLLISSFSYAQNIGINGTGATPDASAILDIVSSDKGMLAPRVALTSTATAAPVATPANALLVFNTNTTGDVTPGFYYWSSASSAWVRVLNNGDSSGDDWKLTGNAGTTAGTNYQFAACKA